MRRELLSTVLVLGLASPALAAGPTCQVIPQISPADQIVSETDKTGAPTQVKLNGTASKDTTGYLWELVDGPAIAFSNPTAALPTFSAPSVGPAGATLTIRLTASGCSPVQKVSTTTTVKVTNVATNQAPVPAASYTPSMVYEGTVVTLDGSASTDPDGNTLSYTWLQMSGPSVTLTSNGAKATFTAPSDVPYPGGASLTFRLTVSDGTLASSTDQIVNVQWVNDPPKAALSCPETVNEGAIITLDGSGSTDSDDGIATYAWSQALGTPNATIPDYDATTAQKLELTAPLLDSVNDTMHFKLLVTDKGALSDSSQCQVKVLDVTAPVLGSIPADITAEATSASGSPVGFSVPTALDNVDGILNVTCSPTSGATFPLGTSTVTCGATDNAQNSASATFNVKVQDTIAPAVTAPSPITAEATGLTTELALGNATATDAVGVKAISNNAPSPAAFPVGTTMVTWFASDEAGNVGTATQSVTVQDTTPPVVTPPAEVIVEATAPESPVAIGTATATDAVGVTGISNDAPPLFPVGTTTVTWSAKDAAGNVGTGKQSVVVRDTTPPVITPPAAVTAEATGVTTSLAIGAATAIDVVGVESITNDAPPAYPVGTTIVTWTAKDAAGNTATAKQAVTVQDTTPPAVTPSAAVTVEATGPATSVAFGTATATDAVGVKTLTNDAPVTFPVGTTTITWTATDAAGNIGTAKQTVTVKDTTAPVISGLPGVSTATGTTTGYATTGVATITGQAVTFAPTAYDLVDGNVPVNCTPASGSAFALGTTTVTCTSKDTHDNVASVKFPVTVNYGFAGLLAPYGTAKSYKIKSAIPLKWQYTSASGAVLPSTGASPEVLVYKIGEAASEPEAVALDDAGTSGLQYDSTSNTWQFNWKTAGLTPGIYNVYIKCHVTKQTDGPFVIQLSK